MNPLNPAFDLASALAEDHSGTVLRTLKDILEQQRADLRRAADQGLAPDAFTVSQDLQQACVTASAIVEDLWSKRR